MANLYQLHDFHFRYPFGDSSVQWPGTFSIQEGDILLIGGESGAGKSTLLYALKGFIPDTIFGKMSGQVLFRGKELNKLSSADRAKIGFLFQNPSSQMIQRTVRQELAFGMENLCVPVPKINNRIQEFAREFEISELLPREISTLSGGEKQKVALLSILLMDPQVLLFDEPTAFLDPGSAKHFVDLFHKIAQNKTIITVEHNLDYLKPHVNRSVFITRRGDITEQSLEQINWQPSFQPLATQAPGKTILSLENLSFAYDRPLLKRVDLQVKKGEIVAIIGDNGAGKTTLLKLISGVNKKYSGKIFYAEHEIRQLKYQQYYREVSLLMQNPENHFIFDRVITEVSQNRDILQLANLAGYEQRNPFTLSEGEKRRLSLAILWSLRSNLLLLDEPTFGQDSANKANLIRLISDMRQAGKTFLIVSHDLPFIQAVADRVFILKNGSLQEQINAQN
ncbi:MAG: ABC transporter ATP-binding protein [Candidatus Cloacimonadales bacterium]